MSVNPNMALWDSVFKTDPAYTKAFSRSGGFRGTATSPMYLIKRATEKFGPLGIGWGFHEMENLIAENIWFSKVQVWYIFDGKRGQMEQWGATPLIEQRKTGPFVDEEAAKKSVTDAVTKCLSYLGFAADIHMGLFDDSKYVNDVRAEKNAEKRAEEAEKKAASPIPTAPTPAAPEPQQPPKPKQPYDHFKALSLVSAFKDRIGEQDYRRILNELGFQKANEIKTRDKMEAVYLKLAAFEKAKAMEAGNAA